MRKLRIVLKELNEMADFYFSIGKKYTVHRSGNSKLLYVNGSCYYAPILSSEKMKVDMPDEQIYFISKVKRYIEKKKLFKKIKPNYSSTDRIKFFEYNRYVHPGQKFVDCYSVDIEKAYWRSALIDGWVSEELYEEGLGIAKQIRLASLGSWAKNVDVYDFDGREERFVHTIKSKHPHVFFNQANNVYRMMNECKRALLGEKFLFYWTDGLYVVGREAAAVCEGVIDGHGFSSVVKKLKGIRRNETAFIVSERGEKEKVYPVEQAAEKIKLKNMKYGKKGN